MKHLWQLLPQKLRDSFWTFVRAPANLLLHYARDCRRFLWQNTFECLHGNRNIEYNALMLAHMIEKGLALRDTRPFFGADVVDLLIDKTLQLQNQAPSNFYAINTSLNALRSYLAHHQGFREKPSSFDRQAAKITALIDPCSFKNSSHFEVATIPAPPSQYTDAQQAVFADLFLTRHSIRHFSKTPVPMRAVFQAVELAQRSPSSCNLQPTRVLVLDDKELIIAALDIQRGARGFKDEVPLLLVLAYEIGLQIGPRSRNQGYTDTGIFAGNLILALHSINIASCALNWATERHADKTLRSLLTIPSSQNIVMLIACGYCETETRAALSMRRPIEDVCRVWKRD